MPGTFPGERVRFEVRKRGKGTQRGRVLELLEPRPDRREAPCAIADRCGGCPWMTLEPEGQHALQAERGRTLATRVGFEGEVPVIAGSSVGYRRRARLAWKGSALGYRAASSRQVVDAPECLVLQPQLAAGWRALREALGGTLGGSGEIRMYRHGDAAVALLETSDPQPPAVYDACRTLAADPALAGVGLRVGEGEPAVFGELGERYEGPDGQPLGGPPGGFSQAHDPLSLTLARDVEERATAGLERPKMVELHAGHGSFTVLLARHGELRAVEVSESACESLRANLAARGLEATVVAADVADQPRSFSPELDVLVLDPPRTGAREPLERLLASKARPRIVYVSCDLATLERDLGVLREAGYAVEELRLYELFPQTARVEALAVCAPA
ncbi:MAG: class I SAM-dependent RNA methyltransferase [Deltaproteobacteria bacterium]|nr:class I SAM-dependent RNA methyltransferase [Deltaproteobacteria bacterium]